MSIPGAGNPLLLGGAAGAAYKIERSLRFNSADSAYLSRTPASAGNRKTWTWSGWVKRSALGARQALFTVYTSPYFGLEFSGADTITVHDSTATTTAISRQTTAVYRDTSAWYHVVLAYDTTQATAANRVKLYVNGVEVTAFQTNDNPAQNADTAVNLAFQHSIGVWHTVGHYYAGYLADVHFIDGQALTPSSFGEFDTNGIWQPKAYSGSYGTNGFKLAFADNSAATATTLGKDTSGNGNNWTPNNLSVTAGAGNDSLVDSPTNYGTDTGAGGEVRGNYCTWSPVASNSSAVISNGNLDNDNATTYATVKGTFALASGKWYWEYTLLSAPVGFALEPIGLADINMSATAGYVGLTNNNSAGVSLNYLSNLDIYVNSSVVFTTTGCSINDVIGVAYDADSKKLWFSRNGTWLGPSSPNPATGTSPISTALTGTQIPACTLYDTKIAANFGQRPFAYTAPSGFKALCTQNLPAPTITKPSSVMDVKTIVGADQAYTGFNFSPDLIWLKRRDSTENHYIFDQVRGGNGLLYTNSTSAEITGTTYISEFGSNGFTTTNSLLGAGAQYVAWTWDAGSSTVTNTAGTISSQVRANASAGFSIVTAGYFSGTVGHGLGVAPAMVIVKTRNVANNWFVYHKDSAASGTVANNSYLIMNSTGAVVNAAVNLWNVTSTTVGSNQSLTDTGVYYCFAPVAGYSAFGSYTGNGSADGPFVYTGFRPRWVMVKAVTDAGYNWFVIDSARNTYNALDASLYPNSASADAIFAWADFTANGFKIRSNSGALNTNISTYIYAAFAESPFALARAR